MTYTVLDDKYEVNETSITATHHNAQLRKIINGGMVIVKLQYLIKL